MHVVLSFRPGRDAKVFTALVEIDIGPTIMTEPVSAQSSDMCTMTARDKMGRLRLRKTISQHPSILVGQFVQSSCVFELDFGHPRH